MKKNKFYPCSFFLEAKANKFYTLRCNFCNKFLSRKKLYYNNERCYHCGKNLLYHNGLKYFDFECFNILFPLTKKDNINVA